MNIEKKLFKGKSDTIDTTNIEHQTLKQSQHKFYNGETAK